MINLENIGCSHIRIDSYKLECWALLCESEGSKIAKVVFDNNKLKEPQHVIVKNLKSEKMQREILKKEKLLDKISRSKSDKEIDKPKKLNEKLVKYKENNFLKNLENQIRHKTSIEESIEKLSNLISPL